MPPIPRSDLLVIGVGNPVRSDDRLGLEIAQRLAEHFGPSLPCLERTGPEIELAEPIAGYPHLIVVDAVPLAEPVVPFTWHPLTAAPRPRSPADSHSFDWPALLALTRELYGATTDARLLGVMGEDFELGETLSARAARHAELALAELIRACARPTPIPQ